MPTVLRVTSSVPTFIKTGEKPYKTAERFQLRSYAKYAFHCADFQESQKSSIALRADFFIGCHPSRPRNMISAGRNTFWSQSKV
jgi:hypothetical protein